MKWAFFIIFMLGLLCFAGSDYLIKQVNQNDEIRNPGYFAKLVRNDPPFSPPGLNKPDRQAANFRQRRVHITNQVDDILVADLNKDGLSDVAILDGSSKKILTLMGDTTLKFAKRYERKFTEMEARFAGVADYTEDKILDLAVVNSSNTSTKHFSIFPGDGTGKLKKPITIVYNEPSQWTFRYAKTLDFNGDGKPDLLGLKYDGTLIACRNIGKGKFSVTKIDGNGSNAGLAAGDFDGDKKDDFFVHEVMPYYTSQKIHFFKSNGDGTFTAKKTISIKYLEEDLYAADINNDQKLDLIGSGNFAQRPWTMLGQGNGNMRNWKTLQGDSTLRHGACITDINGDKKPDIVSAEPSGLYYYPAKNKGVYEKYYVLGESLKFDRAGYLGESNVGVGNFNKDKKPDIVGAQYFGESYKPYTNLLFFINGEKPANLQISNLKITSSSFDGTYIYVKGSVDYSGSALDFHYDESAKTPYDSAFMEINMQVDIYVGNYYADHFHLTATVTGEFINKPGTNSGTIDFDLTIPSPVKVIGTYTATTTVKYVYLTDYNLIKSNEIIP
jgi:hypothetical protein